MSSSLPDGVQDKEVSGGYVYKFDVLRRPEVYHSLSEYLAYKLSVQLRSLRHLEYEIVEKENERSVAVVRSRNFTPAGINQVSLVNLACDRNVSELLDIVNASNPNETEFNKMFNELVHYLESAGIADAKDYIINLLWEDLINLNDDRHLGNLVLIMDIEGTRLSPYFDFGNSWLAFHNNVDFDNMEKIIANVRLQPFDIGVADAVRWYSEIRVCPFDLSGIDLSSLKKELYRVREFYPENVIKSKETILTEWLPNVTRLIKLNSN
ncbi:hypothetical protein [Clostridium sp. Marseille-P2415]|uniref:hypothetical protein n=1 Tax=Clostridium sp. Marseille-P2415 TaxID=1805471 RepID=UPI0009886FBA|nr:hypothetical protein [Clostridium sp. Marseille-P2415]